MAVVRVIDMFICDPEGGGGGYIAGLALLVHSYIQSNLVDKICHMWHHVSLHFRWTVDKHGIDQMTINALNMLLLNGTNH